MIEEIDRFKADITPEETEALRKQKAERTKNLEEVKRMVEKVWKRPLPKKEVEPVEEKQIEPVKSVLVDKAFHPFAIVVEEILYAGNAISHGLFRLWVALKSFARDRETCFPGMKTLADMMGVNETGVGRYLKEGKEVGLIKVDRQVRMVGWGVINIYTLEDPKRWWRERGKTLEKEKGGKKKEKYHNLEKHMGKSIKN